MGQALDGVDLRAQSLHTRRLLLRAWQLTDADNIVSACNDPLIQQWLPALPSPYTLRDAHEFITDMAGKSATEGKGLLLAVVAAGRLVGSIGLSGLDQSHAAEIGYWMAPWGRGHGYTAEALDALAGWAFGHGLHRVQLLAATGNRASQRTAETAGFAREGVVRESHRDRAGVPMNMVLYGRLSTDPAP